MNILEEWLLGLGYRPLLVPHKFPVLRLIRAEFNEGLLSTELGICILLQKLLMSSGNKAFVENLCPEWQTLSIFTYL